MTGEAFQQLLVERFDAALRDSSEHEGHRAREHRDADSTRGRSAQRAAESACNAG